MPRIAPGLSQLDELRRCEQPVTGWPAHQGPRSPAGAELDTGLEVDLHLLTEAVAAQVGQLGRLTTGGSSWAASGPRDPRRPAWRRASPVEHRIRVSASLPCSEPGRYPSSPMTCNRYCGRPGSGSVFQLVEGAVQPPHAGHRRVGAQQDGELVAAQANDRVTVVDRSTSRRAISRSWPHRAV